MKKMTKMALVLCATMGLGGCGNLTVPDLNNPGIEELRDNPTRALVLSASTGLLIGHRTGVASQNGYVSQLGVLGREGYILDKADPRFVSEMLSGTQLDPGSPAFGGNFWVNPYANIRNAHTLLDATDKVSNMTDAEKEGIRGFAKTMLALDFLVIINTRDINGAPIDVNRPVGSPLAPIASKQEVFAHITQLLEEGKTHLQASGSEFPFRLSSGFVNYEAKTETERKKPFTVQNFIKFNRAVRARVAVYEKQWAQALAALDESFLTETGPLDLGVYHVFSGGTGDTPNGLNSINIFANPKLLADAEKQAGSTTLVDARVARKVAKAKEPGSWQGITTDQAFSLYEDNTAPVAIIRNEELLLLRAEALANAGAGNATEATRLLNLIRVNSGNLTAIPEDLSGKPFEDELLEQRRFSLLFEGGHRWIDMRRYNRLEELRQEDPAGVDFKVHAAFPIPVAETDARK
ncbi:MAG TPA: RagB/SusD family nutrient uptake outer membrane protein [Archangium sp.]|nr:RagB/SusD family nutrient uptake outer membrane protein [Archangium sp.]